MAGMKLRWPRLLAFGSALVLLLVLVSPLQAQENPKKPAPPKKSQSILTMIEESGPAGIGFLIALGVFSLVMVSISVERLVNLRRGKVAPLPFLDQVQELFDNREKKLQAYQTLSRSNDTAAGKVLRAGLSRAGRPSVEVEKAMEDAVAREMSSLRGTIRPLNVIAGVAPLVGLLGTVVGMIIAFHTTSEVGMGAEASKSQSLAKGIYLALLTTAAGLSIAIPSMLLAAFYNGRIERYFRTIDKRLTEYVPQIGRLEEQKGYTANEEAMKETHKSELVGQGS